jgi:hypothetical protein
VSKAYETSALVQFVADLRELGVTEYAGPLFMRTDDNELAPVHNVTLKLAPRPAAPDQPEPEKKPEDPKDVPKRDPIAELEARMFGQSATQKSQLIG